MDPLDKLRLLEAESAALKLALGAICRFVPEAAEAVRKMAALSDEVTLPSGLDEAQRAAVAQCLSEIGRA